MSTNLKFRLTSAGQAAAWNASNTGIALELTHVQFGSGNRAPTGTETALVTPQAYVAIAAGNRVAPNQIRLSAMLTGTSSFNIAEIGIWKGVPGQPGSVLFAYWSQASGVLGAKAPSVDFIFTHDMVLSDAVAAGSVTVVADTNQSAMLALMAEHETKPDPHVGYMLESVLELTTVPAQKIAPIICVTQPYFRMMVWDGSQYVRPPIVSPNLTGVPTAPTAAPGTNTEQIANTEFVITEVTKAISAGYVKKTGDTMTGTLTIPNGTASGHAVNLGQFDNSLSTNGYQKLPSGLIIQWGRVANASRPVDGTALGPISYPIAFPNAVLSVNAQMVGGEAIQPVLLDGYLFVKTVGLTSFNLFSGHSTSSTFNFGVYWIAIGY